MIQMTWYQRRPNLSKATIVLVAIAGIATVIRVWFALHLPLWAASGSPQDDELLLAYSHLSTHFHTHDGTELLKEMGYPFFLAVIRWFGISYRWALLLLWVIAAISVTALLKRTGAKNRIGLLTAYVFVLFCPAAFDSWAGQRLYRNSIIAPITFILLSGLLLLAFGALRRSSPAGQVALAVWTGLWVLLDYHITETGVWMVPMLASVTLYLLVRGCLSMRRERAHGLTTLVVGLIPVLLLVGGTDAYKAVNQHYFGVSETNTRTQGPFATFMNIAYHVDDRQQWSTGVWVPADTWRQIWAASPTLQQHPDLLHDLMTSRWAKGDWAATPPPGDHPAWAFLDEMQNAGLWTSQAGVATFFSTVDAELKQAIRAGKLAQSGKINLVSGAPGRSISEIWGLHSLILNALSSNLLITGQQSGHPWCAHRDAMCTSAIADAVGIHVLTDTEAAAPANRQTASDLAAWDNVGTGVIWAYRIISVPLLLAALLGIGTALRRLVRTPRTEIEEPVVLLGAVVTLLACAAAVIVGTAWFIQWIFIQVPSMTNTIMEFYTVGAMPCLMMALLLSATRISRRGRAVPPPLPLGRAHDRGLPNPAPEGRTRRPPAVPGCSGEPNVR